MTTGVLLYSFNNGHTNYSQLTVRCIEHIKNYLDLPVTVVGDREFAGANSIIVDPKSGNRRVYQNTSVNWFNLERMQAYEYSPYDRTILMDCDYFVMSDRLKQLSTAMDDILVHDRVYDITGQNNLWSQQDCQIPLVWATVVIFKKNSFVNSVFQMIQHIAKNYTHYKNLYRLRFNSYRNDYAFAIALHQLYGQHTNCYTIPDPMFMMGLGADVLELTQNSLTYRWKDQYATLTDQDVHIFNKDFINGL